MKSSILFGTAGVPLTTKKRDTLSGIKRVKELGLQAMELEFVHGVRMKPELAGEVKKIAEKNDISLSIHGPYYINLNSKEPEKRDASRTRILDSMKIGSHAGVGYVTFHPAFFQKMDTEQVFQTVKKQLQKIMDEREKKKYSANIKPETTGKPTQFGSLTELLRMYSEIGIPPYIDFSHVHARDNGRFKKKEDVRAAFEEVEKTDSQLLKTLNMHMSGIAYSEKGERNHLVLQDSKNDFPYKWVLDSLKEFDCKGTVICESPDMEKDALLMQAYYRELG
jgi:deoxyribonuclease IV